MECKIRCNATVRQRGELLYEVSILSDSLLAQSDCQVSYCQIHGLHPCSDCAVVIVSSSFTCATVCSLQDIYPKFCCISPSAIKKLFKNYGLLSKFLFCKLHSGCHKLIMLLVFERSGMLAQKSHPSSSLRTYMCRFPVNTHMYVCM